MDVGNAIADLAAVIGEPVRLMMLWSLMDGRARPAGELAFHANVSAQSASTHLAKLLRAGMLTVEPQGKRRYYRLSGPDVAHTVEAMIALANPMKLSSRIPPGQSPALKFARTCYDHMAGTLAVEIYREMQKRRLLISSERNLALTDDGKQWLNRLGIDTDTLRQNRRAFALQCLDWSERHHHLAGALGAGLLSRMIALGWVAPANSGRVLRVTIEGRKELHSLLDLNV